MTARLAATATAIGNSCKPGTPVQQKELRPDPLQPEFFFDYLPFHCGARFSAKAFGPSRRSSLRNIAATAG